MASIADRYGKRIAYFQSLPTVENIERLNDEYVNNDFDATNPFLNQWDAGATRAINDVSDQTETKICPIYEDGTTF